MNKQLNGYTLTSQISENTFESTKTEFDRNSGDPITTKYIIKKVNNQDLAEKLVEISKSYYAEKYIQRVVDYFTENNEQYVVSEFLEGENLKNANPETNQLVNIMNQMAEIVNFLHVNGIAHQNIKPSKFIFKDNQIKLTDFSQSCGEDPGCEPVITTEYYTPPELFEIDVPTFRNRKAHDIWSTGVVLFQLANNNENYIDFDSHDSIAKDIQLKTPKKSENSYDPVNQIIDSMLTDQKDRINSAQFLMLSNLARPGCEIDSKIYTRNEIISILIQKEIEIPENALDNELCELLTEHLKICKLQNKNYSKEQIHNLAQIIMGKKLEFKSTKELCEKLNKILDHDFKTAELAGTDHLIKLIKLMGNLKYTNDSEFDSVEKIYERDLKLIKELNLIEENLLRSVQTEQYTMWEYYKETKVHPLENISKFQNNKMIEILLSLDSETDSEYKKSLIN